jgi:hypothetical protein
VEHGVHSELIKQDGLYRRIYDLELKDQEEALGQQTSSATAQAEQALPASGGGA